jgi:hypothetical protein
MVAARYAEHKRQPLLDLADEFEREAKALNERDSATAEARR